MDNSEALRILEGLAHSDEHSCFPRLALIERELGDTWSLMELKRSMAVVSVSSISLLRAAFSVISLEERATTVALDIRTLPIEDTRLFASLLQPEGGVRGTVYVMTPDQYACFGADNFGFVVR